MSTRRRHEEEGAAAAGGAAAGQSAYQEIGYATKHRVDRLTRKGNPGVSAAQVSLQDKALRANKKRYGMHLPSGSPGRDNVGYHRAYPSSLPHSREIRVLGHTHEGKLGLVVGAGATIGAAGLGALAVHHATKKKVTMTEVNKSAFDDVVKYLPGTITYHHEQAQIHARKKASASRGIAYGVGGAGLGSGVFLGAENIGREVGFRSAPATRVANIKQATKLARRGGAGLAIGGATLAGGSLVRRVHHARQQNIESKRAQHARVERNAAMAKSSLGWAPPVEITKKRLTSAERNALPDSAFADPKNRRFPMNDKAHAQNALARAHQGFAGAKLTRRIERTEDKMLSKSAFGVEHAIDKGIIGSVIDTGITAMRGVKNTFNASPSAMKAKGALKPLATMAQANPGKTALLGGGGAGIGAVIGRKSKSPG